MRKIGILGGTFHPVHVGHLRLAIQAKEAFALEEMWLMPAAKHHFKDGEIILPGRIRADLLKKAVADLEGFSVCDVEWQKEGYTYTCETMEELKKAYPEDRFYFLMGADCLAQFSLWREPGRIMQNCDLIAACRAGSDLSEMRRQADAIEESFGGKVHLLEFPDLEISSTDIRNRILTGRSVRYLVPDAILAETEKLIREEFSSEKISHGVSKNDGQ